MSHYSTKQPSPAINFAETINLFSAPTQVLKTIV